LALLYLLAGDTFLGINGYGVFPSDLSNWKRRGTLVDTGRFFAGAGILEFQSDDSAGAGCRRNLALRSRFPCATLLKVEFGAVRNLDAYRPGRAS
jgi:hypothetical protein